MDKYIKLLKYSEKLLSHHNISMTSKEKYKIIKEVAMYLDAVIFNIISIFCLISILNNSTRITPKTLEVGKKYIESKCGFNYMSGGDSFASPAFLGKTETMYSSLNPTNDLLRVDFSSGILRPQIGGNHNDLHKIIKKYIKDVLIYHSISASQKIKSQLCTMINFHLECFIKCIKHHNATLTITALNKIVKDNKILHPLK